MNRPTQLPMGSGLGLIVLLTLVACQSAYYGTMEKFGYHKRDILVNRVQDARNSQQEAKEQFQSALDRFNAVIGFEGGELETRYETLRAELERSEAKAKAVHDRIDAVEDVAKALFREWEAELEQYSSERLRAASRDKLEQTRARYEEMIVVMRGAEERIEPVLAAFQDMALFMKHNLNAMAVASLREEMIAVETDVSVLIDEMNESIREADQFIQTMSEPEAT